MAYEYEKLGEIEIEIPNFTNPTGEIHGSFNEKKLKDYIKTYGSENLIKELARMSWKVIDMEDEIKRFHYSEDLKAGIIQKGF